jgi:hypothetical protein
MQATARCAVLAWLDQPEDQRDPAFIPAMRAAMISAITTESATVPEPGLAGAARTLRANLPGQTSLSPAEQHLLTDWLDRLSAGPGDHLGTPAMSQPEERIATRGHEH